MKTIAYHTLGCKVNQYDTQAMEELLTKAGYKSVPFLGPADVFLINTCTVTGTGDKKSIQLSLIATGELDVLEELIGRILDYTEQAFKKRDIVAAAEIEPFEEVVDDMVNVMRKNHMHRLSKGLCTVTAGADFLDVLHDIERISDICSNVGLATLARVYPELSEQTHDYIYRLHTGGSDLFNQRYQEAKDFYMTKLKDVIRSYEEKPNE